MTPSRALFLFCIAFILGIGLGSIFKIPQIFIWVILILAAATIYGCFLLNKNIFLVAVFFILFFILGFLRLQVAEFNFNQDKLRMLNDSPQKINIDGLIVDDPDVRDSSQRL